MSHALLFSKAASDPAHAGLFELSHKEHMDVAMRRLADLQQSHRNRIAQTDIDRRLLTGDIWIDQTPAEGERRVTLSTATQLVNLGSAMLLGRPPTFTVLPFSQEPYAQVEADTVQRFLYAAFDNIDAYSSFGDWAKEVMLGAGVMHMIPWRYAEDDEVPVNLDVPEAGGVLWHTGPRGLVDYCFIRHEMSEYDLNQLLGAYTEKGEDTLATKETWCYYAEERFLLPGSTKVEKRILYGIMGQGEWLYPLTDITKMMPSIPVFLAFSSDGFNWRGKEEMRARGIYTADQEALLVASDMFSQLTNGTIRVINPAMARWTDGNTEPADLDFSPGAVNEFSEGERLEAMIQSQPSSVSYEFYKQFMEYVAGATLPQLLLHTQDLEGVAGAAFAENMQPVTARNQIRQMNLGTGMRRFARTFLRHVASVMDPVSGMELYGVDPRDGKAVQAIAHPQMLLNNTRIVVKLSQQAPRALVQYIAMIQQLGDKGYLPRALVTEQTADLLQLPVTDMSSISQQLASDDYYKLTIEALRAKAQQASGYLKQEQYNRGEQPGLLSDGTAPVGLHSSMEDPVLQGEMQPITQAPVSGSQPIGVPYNIS
jgi:hypothetical protein